MGLVSAMAGYKKIILAITVTLSLFLILLIFARKPIVTFLAQTYLRSHNVHASFHLSELTWKHISVDDIVIEKTSRIKNVSLRFSPPWHRPWDWSHLNVAVEVLDIDTLLTLAQRLKPHSPSTPETSSQPSSSSDTTPAKAIDVCQQYNHRSIHIVWRDLIFQQKQFPLNLVVGKGDGTTPDKNTDSKEALLSAQWNAPNLSEGHFVLDCRNEALFLQGKTLLIDIKDLTFRDIHVRKFYLKAQNSFVKWDHEQNKQAVFAGSVDADLRLQQKDFSLRSSPLVLTAQSFFNQPEQLDFHFIAKNLDVTWGKHFSSTLLEIASTLQSADKKAKGRIDLQELDIKEIGDKGSIFLHNINSKSTFDVTAQGYSAVLDLWNAKKKLFFQQAQLKGEWTPSSHTLFIPREKARWTLDSNAFKFAPALSKYIKGAAGTLLAGGTITYQNDKLDGDVSLKGQQMEIDIGLGTFSGIDFSHRIQSFENWRSPPHQSLFIKKFVADQSMQNIRILYEIKNLDHIHVEQLSLNMDQATISAQPFGLFPLKKKVEDLFISIRELSLEKLFTIGLKDSVTSDALLNGDIKANFIGTRPVLSGQLFATKPGFIQYRSGHKTSTKLSMGDGPLDILYNYLDDFQYQTLSLDVSSDKNYQMLLHLETLGRNPKYLGGKPLKLNIKLEQNLLAAVQSLMLTYDLPDRIKEKLEKAEQ